MKLTLNISPSEGTLSACAVYIKSEIKTGYFYINREAVIESLVCDGTVTSPQISLCMIDMFNGYKASKVTMPAFTDRFEIRYTLALSGETGCCPYVRERITPDFTFIRWETFPYPMFFTDWESFNSNGFSSVEIEILAPDEYNIVASVKESGREANCGISRITYSSDIESSNIFDCAVAPYVRLNLEFGLIYLLGGMAEERQKMIETAIKLAFDYMCEHFGCRKIRSDITFAAIPEGFGSFACPESGVIFVDESTFNGIESLNCIIHEFIHLAWNAAAKDTVRRSRFFDEAFTSYFETRVMRHLLSDESAFGHRYNDHGIDSIKSGRYQLVPICEYATMEYGDLSYSIGALCLDKLCELMGETLFDAVTTEFLGNHADAPVDFAIFCSEYTSLCDEEKQDEIARFFDDWIYSCNGLKKYASLT